LHCTVLHATSEVNLQALLLPQEVVLLCMYCASGALYNASTAGILCFSGLWHTQGPPQVKAVLRPRPELHVSRQSCLVPELPGTNFTMYCTVSYSKGDCCTLTEGDLEAPLNSPVSFSRSSAFHLLPLHSPADSPRRSCCLAGRAARGQAGQGNAGVHDPGRGQPLPHPTPSGASSLLSHLLLDYCIRTSVLSHLAALFTVHMFTVQNSTVHDISVQYSA